MNADQGTGIIIERRLPDGRRVGAIEVDGVMVARVYTRGDRIYGVYDSVALRWPSDSLLVHVPTSESLTPDRGALTDKSLHLHPCKYWYKE